MSLITLPVDTHSFSAIEEVHTKYRLRAINDNRKLVLEVEEGIRYQYELHEKTASYLLGKYSNGLPPQFSSTDKRLAMSQSLYIQNFKMIYAAYTIILDGNIAASRVLARRIHESILEQYYVGLCNEFKFLEYAKLSKKDHNPSKLSGKKHKPSKLGYNFYKQNLYTGDLFKNMSEIYSELSNFTHSTWKTLIDIEYDKSLIRKSLLNLRHNLLFNVLSYCQVYTFDESFPKIFLESVQLFVDEQLHNSNYQLTILFPNKENITDKLLWNPANPHPGVSL